MSKYLKSISERQGAAFQMAGGVRGLITLLVLINLVVTMVPFAPVMPAAQLDPSWMFGINQALAQGLVFGRELVFTFGPYGSLFSWLYHPGTDMLMLACSLALSVGWALALFGLASKRMSVGLLLLSLFLLCANSRDLQLLGFPFVLMLWGISSWSAPQPESQASERCTQLAQLYTYSLLGLLPLVKLSTLPLSALAVLMACGLLLAKGRIFQAVLFLGAPVASTVCLWLLAGQPLEALPDYFSNGGEVISGYSEAMAITGEVKMPVLYLLTCLGLAAVILGQRDISLKQRVCLLLAFASFLFIALKAGLVRHDGHARISAGALVLATFMLLVFVRGKVCWLILIGSLLINNYIDQYYNGMGWRILGKLYSQRYAPAAQGLYERIATPHSLVGRYQQALVSINTESGLPKLPGTSDIYSYEQSVLLASGNRWSPRPVLQSYSAYTPKLAELNLRHLQGPAAPDNIFFRVQTIDNRLPALEDGPSLLELMRRYEPAGLHNDFLYLRKRSSLPGMPFKFVSRHSLQVGSPHRIDDKGSLFARLTFKKTTIGRLSELLFKPAEVSIWIETQDGERKRFRLIPRMGAAGFILSPLIEKTEEFAWLAGQRTYLLPTVKQITLDIDPKYRLLWESSVELEIFSFEPPAVRTTSAMPLGLSASIALPIAPKVECIASIDAVDTLPVNGKATLMRVMGWLAVDKKGGAADRVLVTLRPETGPSLHFASTKHYVRPDVSAHLKAPIADNVGFTALIDVSGVSGRFELSLGKQFSGRTEACSNQLKMISFE